jgi:hypothetical protein
MDEQVAKLDARLAFISKSLNDLTKLAKLCKYESKKIRRM